MKSYTDIEQSRKLAEFLPLKSADMYYSNHSFENGYRPIPHIGDYSIIYNQLPCWSLAALLGVLPEIQGSKPVISLYDNYITYPHMSGLHTKADNLVDACVAMIEKIHVLNLL